MTCPFLDYRDLPGADALAERPYCTAAEQFVQPLRADVCNDRYDFVHDAHCEIYIEHAEETGEGTAAASEALADDGENVTDDGEDGGKP